MIKLIILIFAGTVKSFMGNSKKFCERGLLDTPEGLCYFRGKSVKRKGETFYEHQDRRKESDRRCGGGK